MRHFTFIDRRILALIESTYALFLPYLHSWSSPCAPTQTYAYIFVHVYIHLSYLKPHSHFPILPVCASTGDLWCTAGLPRAHLHWSAQQPVRWRVCVLHHGREDWRQQQPSYPPPFPPSYPPPDPPSHFRPLRVWRSRRRTTEVSPHHHILHIYIAVYVLYI